ncbi:MAG: hypothetical protein Q4E17_05265 [Synergistes sp.]|nr:hypothetical protein [Synergistes sp.]
MVSVVVKKVILSVLAGLVLMLPEPVHAASKFIQVWRGGGYDMYVNTATVIKVNGVTSFWVKSVYSDQAKAAVRKELPAKVKKLPIEYGMDYFQYDSKKKKYNIKMSSVYSGSKEVFREGNKKWLPLKNGTLAATVYAKVVEYLEQKNSD